MEQMNITQHFFTIMESRFGAELKNHTGEIVTISSGEKFFVAGCTEDGSCPLPNHHPGKGTACGAWELLNSAEANLFSNVDSIS